MTRLAEVRHANTLTYGMGALWVVTTDNAVLRIDPRTGRVTRRIPVPADSLSGMAAGAGALWVTDPVDGVVWRIQLGPPRLVMRTIEAGIGAAAVAVGANAVWVVNGADTMVVRIDPVSGRASRRHLPRPPLAVAAAPGGDAWVSLADASPAEGEHAGRKGGARERLVLRHGPGRSGRRRRRDRLRPAVPGTVACTGPRHRCVDPARPRVAPLSRGPPDGRLPGVRRLDEAAWRLRGGDVRGECPRVCE